jgi:hypothetical protein
MLLVMLSGSAVAQEREWMLDAADQDVFLVFGVPNTNDVGVSFWCRIGKPDITIFLPLPANEKNKTPELIVQFGEKTFALKGTKPAEDNGQTVEAKLKDRKGIVDGLQANDRFTITIAKHTVTYPLEGADIEGFLKLCDSPGAISN